MIGFVSRTTSPSSVVIRRSTPWVAGWCGPKLIVRSSSWRSPPPTAPGPGTGSVIPARVLALIEGVEHRLAAHREVAPLREALVVLRHQDAARVGVAFEDHAEHVVDLALLVV